MPLVLLQKILKLIQVINLLVQHCYTPTITKFIHRSFCASPIVEKHIRVADLQYHITSLTTEAIFSIMTMYLSFFQCELPGPKNCTRVVTLYHRTQGWEPILNPDHVSIILSAQYTRFQELCKTCNIISTVIRKKTHSQTLPFICHPFSTIH